MKGRRTIIGITGGIGSGKSTALRLFRRAGFPTISADTLARQELFPGHRAYREVVKRYPDVLTRGRVNRKALARIVFSDPRRRKQLEHWIHPMVIRRMRLFTQSAKGLVALDIPLLFEAKLEHLVDQIVCVWCRPSQQVSRVMKRSGWSRREVLQRVNAQWPIGDKAKRADIVLDNAGAPAKLASQVRLLLKKLRGENSTAVKRHL